MPFAYTNPFAPESRTCRKYHALPPKRREKSVITSVWSRRLRGLAVAATKASLRPLLARRGM